VASSFPTFTCMDHGHATPEAGPFRAPARDRCEIAAKPAPLCTRAPPNVSPISRLGASRRFFISETRRICCDALFARPFPGMENWRFTKERGSSDDGRAFRLATHGSVPQQIK
jgi:hypothetical protein